MPPFFIGTAMEIPSGISCMQIAIASEYPKVIDASNPEPIAKPSGKLCSANPIDTIIPVFNKLFFSNFLFLSLALNFFSTKQSHNIIQTIPKIIPIIALIVDDIFKASGIKSKLSIAVIRPDANDKIKLKNLLDGFLNLIPIIPPIVVPNVPKNNPTSVVLNNENLKGKKMLNKFITFYFKEFCFIQDYFK